MSTTLAFKSLIDLPVWEPITSAPNVDAVGKSIAFDLRNDANLKNPYIWRLSVLTALQKYSKKHDSWYTTRAFTAVGGAVDVGSHAVFCPSHGPSGTVAGSPTTTSFTLAALPNTASAAINQFANAGEGTGYYIRVIDKTTGKTEERAIVANTAGTTPVVTVSPAFTFTPTAAADKYEMLSGRVYMLGSGTTAAGYWKAYDIATGTISGNLAVTNLSATIGVDTCSMMLDESYVPSTEAPGEGFVQGAGTYDATLPKACLTATATAAASITGQASGGDYGIAANLYRNYQIRIVEDTGTPAANGQRRKIISHTGGAIAPVYTVAAWTNQPSSTAKYVIELANDLLLWTNGATVTYSYAAGGYAADANWSTAAASGGGTQWANPPAAHLVGTCAESAFSITPVANVYNSFIYWFLSGAQPKIYYLDTAAGANGVWSAVVTAGGDPVMTGVAGTCSACDPSTNAGRYVYLYISGQAIFRFDMNTMTIETYQPLPIAGGTAVASARMAIGTFVDGTTKLSFLYNNLTASSLCYRIMVIG